MYSVDLGKEGVLVFAPKHKGDMNNKLQSAMEYAKFLESVYKLK